ncbi:MAG: hypothetical protein QXL10_05720 [Candidatus Bathyarchaeia archaeon]
MSKQKTDYSKFTDFEITMLIIERNTCEYKREQIEELLNEIGKTKGFVDSSETEPATIKEDKIDFENLSWEKKQGEKGEYEQTSEKANQNNSLWQQLKAALKEHDGFWQNNGYKYWFHRSNAAIIDRHKT